MTPDSWQRQADRLAAKSLAAGDPTGWFDELWSQGRDGTVTMPWNSGRPHPLLESWGRQQPAPPVGRRAAVVGCGLGADAEFLAAQGYQVTAFDVSSTAIDLARSRHQESNVDYRQADLFALPPDWVRSFTLVVDVFTVQALPRGVRAGCTAAIADLVAPAGTLLLVMAALGDGDDPEEGPPWPLTRTEIESFADSGLAPVQIEQLPDEHGRTAFQWRAEFRGPTH